MAQGIITIARDNSVSKAKWPKILQSVTKKERYANTETVIIRVLNNL